MEFGVRVGRENDAVGMSAVILRALREINAKDYSADIIQRVELSFSPSAARDLIGKRKVFVAEIAGRIVGTASLDGGVVRKCSWIPMFKGKVSADGSWAKSDSPRERPA